MERTYRRGDIFIADLGEGIGSEQQGIRPVIVERIVVRRPADQFKTVCTVIPVKRRLKVPEALTCAA